MSIQKAPQLLDFVKFENNNDGNLELKQNNKKNIQRQNNNSNNKNIRKNLHP